ncbi:integral membrane sensor protein [Pseudofrankia inefficax]|uniref:Putative integral membrane sensor protein n=1 Tax=Pseudofrankia inefficax (strain DSM 45817 / CECT 9037 / DDB 130130 / EuI1c) TaxID=298654 RepID=E3J796_PSEI1|nr:integral membrane sensor protein [Pseudofrankia inefficax]ADP78369.1 putative integral membrane sensor protein [Pseudofrankia inefficax]
MTVAAAVPVPHLTSLASGLAAKEQLSSSCGPSIAVSYLLAAAAALAALTCAARIRLTTDGRRSRGVRGAGWTAAAAVAVGAAVWSTQLAGTVSCEYSGTALFDLRLIVMGALVVPLATGAGLAIVATSPASSRRLVVGGIVSGAGWSAASFMTIAALRTTGTLGYDLVLAALSVVMNVATATVLCWVAFRPGERYLRDVVAAMLLGAAIRGGYYTALVATRTIPDAKDGWSPGLDPFALGLVTAAGSTIVLMFIAVAAVGGLLQPRVAGFGTTTRPWAPRRGGTAIRRPTPGFGPDDAHAARPGDGPAPPEPKPAAAPVQVAGVQAPIPVKNAGDGPAPVRPGAEAALPVPAGTRAVAVSPAGRAPTQEPPASLAHAELTFEELAYVGRSFTGSVDDAVELLELADDEPADARPAPGQAAIDDVPAVDPEDIAPFDDALAPVAVAAARPAVPPPGGREPAPAGPPPRAAAPDSGELVSVLVPAPLRAPRSESPGSGEQTGEPASDPEVGSGPTRRPTVLTPSSPVWTAALPAGVPAGPPAGPPGRRLPPLPSVPPPAPGTVATGAAHAVPWSADPLGISVTTAQGAGHDGTHASADEPWTPGQLGGVGPQPRWAVPLWFPPPAWWFLTPALGRHTVARHRADDPSAPTRPLRLAPARPEH